MNPSQLLLRRLLDQAGGPAETGYVLVLDGEGLSDLPAQMSTQHGCYTVQRVVTEVGLRHTLWKARGAPLIAVLPEDLAHRLPLDLLRRAKNQRVHALSVNDVLEVVLGVRVVGADAAFLQELALQYVQQLGEALSRRTLPTVVDRRLLTELLVDVSVGEQVRTQAPADLLATWLTHPPSWSPSVRKLICDALPTLHGDEGRLLAWGLEDPSHLRAVVVHGALLTVEQEELPKKVWGPLWSLATRPPVEMDRRILRRTVVRLLEGALSGLGEQAGELLFQADRLGREYLTPSQLATSRVLPLAFQDRCQSLARQAAEGKPISAGDITWLRDHRAASRSQPELQVLEALARLSRFLDRLRSSSLNILDQIVSYQTDSAFADLAASQLRRAMAGSGLYHADAAKVLEAYRTRRNAENRQFAETLAAGYEAGLHRQGVIPLHRLWKRLVEPAIKLEPGKGLFLVVLDGCSYPVFLELLYALSQEAGFPIGIKPDPEGRVRGLPALAPLPTVTSHARGALFLGELPQDPLVAETVFRDQEEAKTDKARFAQNAALIGQPHVLFLKGDLADHGQALLEAVQTPSIPVVAAVFNAVDDMIGSSNTGAVFRLSPADIIAFVPSLRAALKAGRRVLLTADHGHSPFVDKTLRVGSGATPRFICLEPHAPVPDGFLEIDLAGLGGPPGRRAFAWQQGVYQGLPQAGFHGGCSLEEMVVPMAWLEREGLQADEPEWWFGRGVLLEPATVKPLAGPLLTPLPSEPPRKTPPMSEVVRPTQVGLFDLSAQAISLPLPAAVREGLHDDEKRVLLLLKEVGSARSSELAQKLNKNPMRVNGLIRTLRRTLHAAGVELFTDEVLPDGETLYRYKKPDGESSA